MTQVELPLNAVSERCWLMLPRPWRKWGALLLSQQCWCWGYDARHRDAAGDCPLTRYGFVRHRPPEGERGSTNYRWHADGRSLGLWGFGLCYSEAERGAVFVRRFDFAPRYCATVALPQDVCRPPQLSQFRPPLTKTDCQTTRDLLRGMLSAVADYEAWVVATTGLAYREASLRAWTHQQVAAPEIAPEWRRLSDALPDRFRLLRPKAAHPAVTRRHALQPTLA